jgi:hypothetical protein
MICNIPFDTEETCCPCCGCEFCTRCYGKHLIETGVIPNETDLDDFVNQVAGLK